MSRSELSQVNSEICQSTVTLRSGGVGAHSAEETEGGTKEAGGAGRSPPPLAAAPSEERESQAPKTRLETLDLRPFCLRRLLPGDHLLVL